MQISLQDSLTIPTPSSFATHGEVVILDLESSTYFGLDPVGARMWTLVSEHGSLSKVYEVLREEYDVEAETLKGDLLQLTGRFCERGLAQVVKPQ